MSTLNDKHLAKHRAKRHDELLNLLTPEVIGLMRKMVEEAERNAHTKKAADLLRCLEKLVSDLFSLANAPDCEIPELAASHATQADRTSDINRVMHFRRIHAEHEKGQAKFDRRVNKVNQLMGGWRVKNLNT